MTTQVQNQAASIALYTSNPRINSRHCMALAMQLQRTAPAGLSGDQSATLALISPAAAEVEQVRKTRSRTAPSAQRVPRLRVITGWTAVKNSIGAMATIPPELGNEGQEAQHLDARLFPDGLSFIHLDAVAVWSQTKELLERLEEEGLTARVNALINPKLLASVTRALTVNSQRPSASSARSPLPRLRVGSRRQMRASLMLSEATPAHSR